MEEAQPTSSAQQPLRSGDDAPASEASQPPLKHEETRPAEPGSTATPDAGNTPRAPPVSASSDQLAAPNWWPSNGGAQLRGMPDSVSPGSTESSYLAMRAPLQMPMAESRQEEEFLMSFASQPGGMPCGPGMATPGPRTPLPPQHLGQESMQHLMHQSMYPDASQLPPGMYSPAGMPYPGPPFGRMAAPPQSAAAAAAHPPHTPRSDGSPPVLPRLQQEELRDPGRMSAGMPRCASEGVMRASAGSHARSRSAGGGRGPAQAPGAGQPRPLDSPDFAMIYAFLGSMFDPVCHMINHADVMQQMTPVDRETAALILGNCVHNFATPGFVEELLAQLRAPKQPRRAPLAQPPAFAPRPPPEQQGGLP